MKKNEISSKYKFNKYLLITIIIAIIMVFMYILFCGVYKNNDKTFNNDINDKVTVTPMPIEYYDAYASIDSKQIHEFGSILCLSVDISDPKVMDEISTSIVIATVKSIDGGSVINEVTQNSSRPITYGKLVIDKVIKGDLAQNDEILYTRLGGIVSYEDYFNSLNPAKQNNKYAQVKDHLPYIKYIPNTNNDIEVGKTYLIYLGNPDDSVSKIGAYGIVGMEGGLREVKSIESEQSVRLAPIDLIQVFNNLTHMSEDLDSVYPMSDID